MIAGSDQRRVGWAGSTVSKYWPTQPSPAQTSRDPGWKNKRNSPSNSETTFPQNEWICLLPFATMTESYLLPNQGRSLAPRFLLTGRETTFRNQPSHQPWRSTHHAPLSCLSLSHVIKIRKARGACSAHASISLCVLVRSFVLKSE